ncbi:MAG: hypothetical protein U9O94_06150 [Nanoarchaeota archaeon]|nr:hypothetical protein [Nanoarchaeota archaeon]
MQQTYTDNTISAQIQVNHILNEFSKDNLSEISLTNRVLVDWDTYFNEFKLNI